MNEYLQKRGRRALEDGQFVAFDNKTIPAPREQVVQLFAAVEYLLIRTNGQAYQNDSFIVAKQELEKKKLLLLKERENQVKEMVEKEMEKIIRAHRAEAEELAQAILSREKELERLGTEQRTQRMEFQRQIESLKYQIENDKQTAQLEIQRAETEIRNESMAARNDQIRRLEFMLSGKPSAGLLESVAAAVGKMLDNWLSGCFPASVTVQTIRGPKKLDSLEVMRILRSEYSEMIWAHNLTHTSD